jgi:ABC-type multidrug transport system fused ATPase/permease subunit
LPIDKQITQFFSGLSMVVRRSDARRRRFVVDPAAQSGDVDGNAVARSTSTIPPSSPPKRSKSQPPEARAYTYGADRRNQLKTTDLIPKRVISYLLVVLLLLGCLALVNFCASHSPQWHSKLGDSGLIAFAISGQGSIANWFLSFLLILTGLSCLQIYAIRQHRCDDYRGTYRLWIWMSALFVVASVNCVVDLSAVAYSLIQALTKQALTERLWLPLAAKLTVLLLLLTRVVYEVRESRGSLVLAAFIGLAYTLALVIPLPAIKTGIVLFDPDVVAGNCVLFGTAMLLLAHLTYGRFIFLQANGLIQQRVRIQKPAKQKKPVTAGQANSAQKKASKKLAAKKKKTSSSPKSVAGNVSSTPSRTETVAAKTAATDNARIDNSPNNTTKSPSERLKELAAASRAKESSRAQTDVPQEATDDDFSDSVIKISKTQLRKQRKLEKQRRRAA